MMLAGALGVASAGRAGSPEPAAIAGTAPPSQPADTEVPETPPQSTFQRPPPDDDEPLPSVADRRFGLGTAAMHLDFVHARDSARLSGLSDYALAGLSFRGLFGRRIGYAPGLDLALGGGGAPGFALDLVLFPAGVGVAFGPTGYFGLRAGIGVSGVTERIPITMVLPAEARLEFDLGRHARFALSGGFTWTPVESTRQGGSAMVPFADESFLALTARLGRTFGDYGSVAGRGPFFRLERREQRRTALFGIAIGYEVDVAQ